jgi:hypothetical protein
MFSGACGKADKLGKYFGIVGIKVQYEVDEKAKGSMPSGTSGKADKLGTNSNRRSLGGKSLFYWMLKFCSVIVLHGHIFLRFWCGEAFLST